MNNLSMLIQFFQFLLQSIKTSRQNATKLIIRLPGSDLLHFSYTHLRPSSSTDETEKTLLEKFVPILSQVLQMLLELHPFCCDQVDSIGIFDRLEKYIQKTSVCCFCFSSNSVKRIFLEWRYTVKSYWADFSSRKIT
jgi:hypothetical protein